MKAPTAVLLVVSIAMCHELSKDEIEEFTDYLWKTSALDQNLKDGTNVGHDDEEEVSEHAWEESGKFEGDLILNERQRRLIVEDVTEGLSRNGLKDSTKRWPNNEVIFYIQREHFSGDQVQAIKEGIDDLSRASCIKFRPYKKGDRDAVVIQGSRRGCFSQVGYQGGYQVLNLSGRHPVGRGCFRHGTVVHELLHTLGFYHMQSSHDRDDYIDVLWENIVKPARHNFRKYNAFAVSDFGVGYDYDSVLHYSRRAFSANGGDTLVPKQNGAQIGQRVGLSDKDTQKLNKMYCDADSNSFDAEGQRPFKPIKKPRNQPFQGHGIGYHQGKTVVIKLPEAESLKSPEPSSYAVFDYFSKVPQALPPPIVQGLGVGKEIAYILPVTLFRDEQVRSIKEPEISRKETPFIVKDTEMTSLGGVKDVERKPDTETLNDSAVRPKDDTKVNQDMFEAFERLGKIIRSHVYPSSKFDATKLYDFNKDYSAFDNPNSKAYESKAKKIHELLSHSPKKPERIETKEKHSGDAEDINNDEHNNKSNVHSNVFVSPLYNKIYNEFDSSFGTSLPNKNKVGETFKIASKYSKPVDKNEFSHVKTYNDYSSLYNSNRKGPNKPYSLLGGPVPLRENWYKENNRPKLDLPKKEYARYADRHKLKTELEPQRDKNILKYKDMISIPYKKKDGSKEDSTSIEYPYKEHSAEKMYDKDGHIGNYKSWSKVRDSSERNPDDKSIELASLKLYGGDRTKHTYDSVSDEDYYSDAEDEAGGPRKDPKANAMKKKSENPIDYKENTFIQDKLYDKYTYKEKQALTPSTNTIQPIAYQVTEEIDEKDHEVPKKGKTTVTPKSDEDYSSFEREMDDRLATILKNYAKIDNFDIESPYGSSYHESSESPEIIREK